MPTFKDLPLDTFGLILSYYLSDADTYKVLRRVLRRNKVALEFVNNINVYFPRGYNSLEPRFKHIFCHDDHIEKSESAEIMTIERVDDPVLPDKWDNMQHIKIEFDSHYNKFNPRVLINYTNLISVELLGTDSIENLSVFPESIQRIKIYGANLTLSIGHKQLMRLRNLREIIAAPDDWERTKMTPAQIKFKLFEPHPTLLRIKLSNCVHFEAAEGTLDNLQILSLNYISYGKMRMPSSLLNLSSLSLRDYRTKGAIPRMPSLRHLELCKCNIGLGMNSAIGGAKLETLTATYVELGEALNIDVPEIQSASNITICNTKISGDLTSLQCALSNLRDCSWVGPNGQTKYIVAFRFNVREQK
jgi:hypothetical protein